MKEQKLLITINKSSSIIFKFVLNPLKTPYWIDTIVKEEANEKQPMLGTIYRNVNKHGEWSEYTITEFKQNNMFTMTSKDKNYHVSYTLIPITDATTKLEYYEWVDKGNLQEPFAIDVLEKLKQVLEQLP